MVPYLLLGTINEHYEEKEINVSFLLSWDIECFILSVDALSPVWECTIKVGSHQS